MLFPKSRQRMTSSQDVAKWLRSKENRRYGVLEEHIGVFEALFSSNLSPYDAALKFDSQVRSSRYTDAAWRFRQVLFALVAEFPQLQNCFIQLMRAIRKVPPRPEKPNSLDAGFLSDWRDMHNSLWGRRTLAANAREGLHASAGITGAGAERARNFVAFSAKLVGEDLDRGEIRSMAFFDIRDALETFPHNGKLSQGCILSDQQLRAVDVEIAALWILHGRQHILGLRNVDFGPGWEAGLAKETERWHGEPGISAKRWKLWANMLSQYARSSGDEADDAKTAALQAAALIRHQQEQE